MALKWSLKITPSSLSPWSFLFPFVCLVGKPSKSHLTSRELSDLVVKWQTTCHLVIHKAVFGVMSYSLLPRVNHSFRAAPRSPVAAPQAKWRASFSPPAVFNLDCSGRCVGCVHGCFEWRWQRSSPAGLTEGQEQGIGLAKKTISLTNVFPYFGF